MQEGESTGGEKDTDGENGGRGRREIYPKTGRNNKGERQGWRERDSVRETESERERQRQSERERHT